MIGKVRPIPFCFETFVLLAKSNKILSIFFSENKFSEDLKRVDLI